MDDLYGKPTKIAVVCYCKGVFGGKSETSSIGRIFIEFWSNFGQVLAEF